MATRPQFGPKLLISATSMGASINGSAVICEALSMISMQFIWSAGATPVGTAKIQVSNDFSIDSSGAILNAGTWSDVNILYNGTSSASVAISGNTGSVMLDVLQTGVYAIRPVFTRTSGTGTLSVMCNAKVA